MSRHNRRRTRGGNRNSSLRHSINASDVDTAGSSTEPQAQPPPPLSTQLWHPSGFSSSPLQCQAPAPWMPSVVACSSVPTSTRSSNTNPPASARQWHNRHVAWQARERRQRQESESLAAEKRRIFGGEDFAAAACRADDGNGYNPDRSDEDDEMLCVKMLEYFGGLDFIEP